MVCMTAKRFTHCSRGRLRRQSARPGIENSTTTARQIRTEPSPLRTPRAPGRENQTPLRNVRSSGCRSGRRSTCADSLRIRLRSSRRNNPQCRNSVRRNSILLAHSRTLLPPSCDELPRFFSSGTRLRFKSQFAGAAGSFDDRLD